MRRKAAALLVYLATKPAFTANRDQVLDDLWPDADPASAMNSLNQSLYFLRREIDPWYEDEISVDYVGFGGELLWLDPALVFTDSSNFLRVATAVRNQDALASEALDLVRSYRGLFAPEFEYEEWAIDWRTKVHSVLLDVAHEAIDRLTAVDDVKGAREVAAAVLDVDPTASDIERALISLLWRTGATSAAKAQYEHLVRIEARDGLEAESFAVIVGADSALK
jgi:DNA-binding SARP family transcriptional activator